MAHIVEYIGEDLIDFESGDELLVLDYSYDNQCYLCFSAYPSGKLGINQLAWIHKKILKGAY